MARSTPAQFAKKMRRTAADMKALPQRQINAGAKAIVKEVDRQLDVAAPTRRLNVGKKGARIGVRTKKPGPDSVLVAMFGPAQLIERDTEAHRIPRTTGKGRKRRGDKQPLYLPGIGFKAKVNHPGTRGKRPWARGLNRALPQVKVAAATEYAATLRRALRG